MPDGYSKTNVDGGAYLQGRGIDIGDGRNVRLFQLFDRYGNDKGGSTDLRADATFTPEGDDFFKEFSPGIRANHRTAESIKS